MPHNFFRPDWHAIKSSIADKETRLEMRRQFSEMKKQFETMCDEQYKLDKREAAKQHMLALRALPEGAMVYYCGFNRRFAKRSATKINTRHAGTKYLTVDFGAEVGKWRIPYEHLKSEPLHPAESANIELSLILSEKLNGK